MDNNIRVQSAVDPRPRASQCKEFVSRGPVDEVDSKSQDIIEAEKLLGEDHVEKD